MGDMEPYRKVLADRTNPEEAEVDRLLLSSNGYQQECIKFAAALNKITAPVSAIYEDRNGYSSIDILPIYEHQKRIEQQQKYGTVLLGAIVVVLLLITLILFV